LRFCFWELPDIAVANTERAFLLLEQVLTSLSRSARRNPNDAAAMPRNR
jgi:hypothetical protein